MHTHCPTLHTTATPFNHKPFLNRPHTDLLSAAAEY